MRVAFVLERDSHAAFARTGASVDVSSKALGGDPFWFDGFDFYNDVKGNFTCAPGGHLG